MENCIITNNLKVAYDDYVVIPNFNIKIKKGKITSIIGANGCGKSTVLKAIGRIIKKEEGSIIINDKDIFTMKNKDIAKEMAILPQTPTAPGSITCFELVSYGRYPYQKGLGKLSQEDKKVINWALNVTNMEEFKSRRIASLSGGQRQRVWIAMSLAQQTNIILLDEPTTYLDLNHQLEVLELLKKLNKEENVTIVMVLHDLNLACKYSDYLLAMKDGRVFDFGFANDVFNENMLKECFAIEGEIIKDHKTNKNVCVSYDLYKKDKKNED